MAISHIRKYGGSDFKLSQTIEKMFQLMYSINCTVYDTFVKMQMLRDNRTLKYLDSFWWLISQLLKLPDSKAVSTPQKKKNSKFQKKYLSGR